MEIESYEVVRFSAWTKIEVHQSLNAIHFMRIWKLFPALDRSGTAQGNPEGSSERMKREKTFPAFVFVFLLVYVFFVFGLTPDHEINST